MTDDQRLEASFTYRRALRRVSRFALAGKPYQANRTAVVMSKMFGPLAKTWIW
jgi:hypothetical protein